MKQDEQGTDYETAEVARSFDRFASTYDAARRKMVPCFDSFYGSAIRLLPFEKDAAIRVLDLGAGTGLLSARVLAAFPNARLRLVDIAEGMLAFARERFDGLLVRERLAETDMEVGDAVSIDDIVIVNRNEMEIDVLDFSQGPLGGPYDAVVSGLAIHHLTDELKRDLFARIFGSLNRGGVFINAEQVLGPTAKVDAEYTRGWLADARRLGASEEEVGAALARSGVDRCATVEAQLGWLRVIGFEDVDCWFKEGRFAVYSGSRA